MRGTTGRGAVGCAPHRGKNSAQPSDPSSVDPDVGGAASALAGAGEAAVGVDPRAADLAMERYAAGDDAAFAQVYDEVAPRLMRHLRRHVACRAVVEDLVQQTFLQMHRARGRF